MALLVLSLVATEAVGEGGGETYKMDDDRKRLVLFFSACLLTFEEASHPLEILLDRHYYLERLAFTL